MSLKHKTSISSAFLRFTSIISAVSLLLLGVLWIGDDLYHFEEDSALLRQEFLENSKREVRQEVELFLAGAAGQRASLEDSLRRNIRDRVNEAWSMADNLFTRNAGRRSREELADMIREALRPIRYNNGRGYFFATGLDGVEQLFPDRPEYEGRHILNMEDFAGKPVIRDMVRIARERGEGYYEYLWTRPGSQRDDHRKLAYIRHFPGLDWLIGTGEYLEDAESDLKADVLRQLERERFGDGGYLFAGTLEGVALTGPAEGRNVIDASDPNGRKVVQEIVAAARQGGGFIEYTMPSVGGAAPHRKLSYVAPVLDWGWYVGAGVNMDKIEQDIARRREHILATSFKHTAILLGLVGFILLIQFTVARRATARRRDGLAEFMNFFRRAG